MREGGREGGKEGASERGRREGEREGGRERGRREGGREGNSPCSTLTRCCHYLSIATWSTTEKKVDFVVSCLH